MKNQPDDHVLGHLRELKRRGVVFDIYEAADSVLVFRTETDFDHDCPYRVRMRDGSPEFSMCMHTYDMSMPEIADMAQFEQYLTKLNEDSNPR